jgi:glycosyltransferase involved in cell wall biosynthesis
MKIGIIAGPYLPVPPVKYGGTEQVIHYILKGLEATDNEVYLIASGDSKVSCTLLPSCPEALYFAKTPEELPAHDLLVAKANEVMKQHIIELSKTVDVIHSHYNVATQMIAELIDTKLIKNIPVLTTIHGSLVFDTHAFYAKYKNMYFNSISCNQQKNYPSLQYIANIYNAEDPLEFHTSTPEDYICFIGRFDREKNPHLAIKFALAANIKIKVAGKIDHLGSLYFKEEVEPYFSNPLVEYMGELNFEQKVKLMSHSKLNLHPTGFREPFGLTVLESQYCGVPTLAINKGAMSEIIEDGRTGLLVEDFEEGIHKIEELFSMDRKYIRDRASHLFNFTKMTQEYIKAYQKVITLTNDHH